MQHSSKLFAIIGYHRTSSDIIRYHRMATTQDRKRPCTIIRYLRSAEVHVQSTGSCFRCSNFLVQRAGQVPHATEQKEVRQTRHCTAATLVVVRRQPIVGNSHYPHYLQHPLLMLKLAHHRGDDRTVSAGTCTCVDC